MAELTEGASSSFSASSSSGSSKFDVFLNFRGKDTRKNFTGFLHKALKNSGINDFIDSEKLWVGEAIAPALHRAIQGSKIFIPVFSKGYASSKWCLMELSHMLHCHESNGQIIMPIFFDVEPAHVRNQSGSFEIPFREHENNFEPQIVESWREALRMAGDLKGWVLKEDTDGDQAELVELVVKRVLRELISNTHLAECKYPIGIDSHVNDLVSLLNIGSNDVQFMGICGFGGIGKTSIAKALYNRTLSSFNRHSFLSDVREQAMQFMGLATLQKRLLKDIFKADFDITDSHRGKKLIEQRLCTENVLLVLDDVDNQDQVNALASEISWFGHGSRVIITTRDEHILNVAKVEGDKIYWPQVLHCKQSLKLFSLHAFSRDQPPEDYMQLSHDVACYSGGLPLTLEVLGSYLSDIRSKEVWESTLQELKEIPHEKVQRRLKISYDNLNSYHKALFLDAACFFIGWEKETVISIWEACGYHPKSAMDKLIKRSLLKFEDNLLRMHDQIRDMGRNIVLEENPMEPGSRSRLWSHGEILEVLEEKKGTDMIKGMMLPYAFPPIILHSEHFEMMHNLRYLNIREAKYMGDFSHLSSGLRWFKWFGCPWDILPTNFYHKSLVYLDLSGSKIRQAWNVRPQDENKRFEKLKVLNLRRCLYLSECPDFSWFPCLERLDLENCNSLYKLDESVGNLSSLEELDLQFCSSLKKLPESIANLKSLVELQMSNVSRVEDLPDGVGLLEKLEVLDAKDCHDLVKLPRSMGRMRCLREIHLNGTQISKLPYDFSMLLNLEKLEMSERLQFLPADLSLLKNLKQLNLCGCNKLEYLPELPSSLVILCCEHCSSLVQLPDLSKLKNLATLKLDGCKKLEKIRGLEGAEALEELNAPECYNLTHSSRKIHGQGTLLPYRSQRNAYSLIANDGIDYKGLILCLVLEFPPDFVDNLRLKQGQFLILDFHISASIRQKDKTTRCLHTLRIEDVRVTSHQHIIIIHRFKGFEWFGFPLRGKDSIENLSIHKPELHIFPKWNYKSFRYYSYPIVKLGEILFENRDPDHQKHNDQHSIGMMVADFFNCSYVEDDGRVPSLKLSSSCAQVESEGANSVNRQEEEEGVLMSASNYEGAHLDDKDEEASCVVATSKEKGTTSSSDDTEEEEERNNSKEDWSYVSDDGTCSGKESEGSNYVPKKEEGKKEVLMRASNYKGACHDDEDGKASSVVTLKEKRKHLPLTIRKKRRIIKQKIS